MEKKQTKTKKQIPSPTGNGRDSAGKFVKGNNISRGNPFAREREKFRAYLLQRITNEDLNAGLKALMERVQKNDINAIRLLFEYTFGKPDADFQESFGSQSLGLKEKELDLKTNQFMAALAEKFSLNNDQLKEFASKYFKVIE